MSHDWVCFAQKQAVTTEAIQHAFTEWEIRKPYEHTAR